MKRREFILALGGAAPWPLAARAQQTDRVRRLGVVTDTAESNPEGQARIAALRQRLHELGWTEGRNLQVDYRWSGGDVERARAYATEIVALGPDVIFALANAQLAPLSQETRTIPIVFVGVSDPVGPGYVASFARPGGNITGFTLYEPSMGGKWVETLKEIAPALTRLALMANPDTAIRGGTYYTPAFKSAAATFVVEAVTTPVRSNVIRGRNRASQSIESPDSWGVRIARSPIDKRIIRNHRDRDTVGGVVRPKVIGASCHVQGTDSIDAATCGIEPTNVLGDDKIFVIKLFVEVIVDVSG